MKFLRKVLSRWQPASHMPAVNRTLHTVRLELAGAGLLEDGQMLDNVELRVSPLPMSNTLGYVFDEHVPWALQRVGYRKGVIYLPSNVAGDAHVPKGTMKRVIRHEYAHAWYAKAPALFAKPFFVKAFGAAYNDDTVSPLGRVLRYQMDKPLQTLCHEEFVSDYAMSRVREDFAETFRVYLKHRKRLDKFEGRPGVLRKLKAVRTAIKKYRNQ